MKKYFAFAAVAMMLAACTTNENESSIDPLAGKPIVVNASVGGVMETRATTISDPTKLTPGFNLRIENKNSSDYTYDVLMNYEDGAWKASDGTKMVWQNSTTPVTVSAYHKYYNNTSPLTKTDGTVVVYTSSHALQDCENWDVLYMAPTEVQPHEQGVEVKLKHLNSKIVITIETGMANTKNPVSGVKIDGVYWARKFNFTTGVWGDLEENDGTNILTLKDSDAEYDATNRKVVYNGLLVPQDIAANTFKVLFTMNETNYTWTSSNAVKLESGKQYALTLAVPSDESELILKSVEITPWGDPITIQGGEVTIVQ